MSDINYRVYVTGMKEAAIDAAKLDAVLKSIGRTSVNIPGLSPMQRLRGSLPGLATSVSPWMASNSIRGIPIMPENFLAGAYRAMKGMASLDTPPLIPPTAGVNWRQAGLGLAAAPFSPWIGARMLSNSMGGMLGGATGGAASAIFGAGGAGLFAAFYVGLRTSGELLKMFAHNLSKAIEEGSKLYQRAAKTANSTGRLAHLDFMGAALGISPSEMETLLVRGEHPLKSAGAKYSPAGIDGAFGAGRGTAQIAALQQMKNLSVEMRDAWVKTADTAREFANTAKALQATHQNITYVQSEWKTLWAQMTTMATPYLNVLNEILRRYLRVTNMGLNQTIQGLQALHIIPKGDPGKSIIPTPRSAVGGSAWERMGFVIGGFGGGNDYARQTAKNTKTIADHIMKALPRGASTGQPMIPSYNLP